MRLLAGLVVVLAACAGSDPVAGGERAACRTDGTCETGLECWSEVCVRPPSADCGAVAARLAPIRLGNYATDSDRAPLVAALRGQCEQARLTAREGQCLTSAVDDDALAECPRPLLPELDGSKRRCNPLGDAIIMQFGRGGALATELRDAVAVSRLVVETCLIEGWPKPVTTCIRDATSFDDAHACLAPLPGVARRRLQRHLDRLADAPRLPPPDPWATPPVTGTLSPDCEAYLAMLTAYASCPKVPTASADALKQSIASIREAWSSMPASSRLTIDDSCRTGMATMQQGMQAIGCPTPP